MYIGYDVKNGVKYAKLCRSARVNGKVVTQQKSLGRVVDAEKGIYQSRERGVFTYDLETDTYGVPDPATVPGAVNAVPEKLILDFGDSWFLDQYIKSIGFDRIIERICFKNSDSVLALLQYYVLCSASNSHASDWYEGSYARILYPEADLESPKVSDMLAELGDERAYSEFFKAYFSLPAVRKGGINLLIDSAGLPGSVHFPTEAVSDRNGNISNKVRLIYAVQDQTNLPVYFSCALGKYTDASALTKTVFELKANQIDTNLAVLDADYFTRYSMDELFKEKISFLSCINENTALYKSVVNDCLGSLESEENLVSYNGRHAYIARTKTFFRGHNVYAYLGRGFVIRPQETAKTHGVSEVKKISADDANKSGRGLFVLISSKPVPADQIFHNYYMRARIEQIFDICKIKTYMMPQRIQTEETFRGHLLIAFMASAVVKLLQKDLSNTSHTPQSFFLKARNHKCKVFDDHVQTAEAPEKANNFYSLFKLAVPHSIKIPM